MQTCYSLNSVFVKYDNNKKTVTRQSLFLRGNFVRLFLNVIFILVLFVVLVLIIVLMFQSWRDVHWMLPTK